MNIRLRFLTITVLLMGVVSLAFAQGVVVKPEFFDSYGSIETESAMARLDYFAIKLQNDPASLGFIICYGPEGKVIGSGWSCAERQRHYLVDARGIDGGRVQTIYAGRHKDPAEVRTELWIVPAGSEPPEPKRFKTKPKKVNGKFAEYTGWDGESEGFGPPVGTSEIAVFADVLGEQPKSVGYIVAFNRPNAAPGAWRRVANQEAAGLTGPDAIAPDRIKILYGGIVAGGEESDPREVPLQLWVLPPDAPAPVDINKREVTPKEAIQLGSEYSSLFGKFPDEERRTFDAFADVLRADEHLNICFIAFPNLDSDEPVDEPTGPPPMNPTQYAEKWRKELVEKSGIPERRVIIINAAPRVLKNGLIEVWAVPQGAPLPDPYKPEPGEIEEEPEGAPK